MTQMHWTRRAAVGYKIVRWDGLGMLARDSQAALMNHRARRWTRMENDWDRD